MPEKKSPPRTTSFWMALLAIVISLVGTGVSIMEARILRDQQQLMTEEKAASVWPFVTSQTKIRETEPGIEILFSLTNKGVGPALINSLTFNVGASSGSIDKALEELDLTDFNFNVIPTLSNQISGSVLAAGESLEVYKLLLVEKKPQLTDQEKTTNQQVSRLNKSSLVLSQISEYYCYCSIYGDCWDSDNQPMTADEACSGREMLRKPE